MKDETEGIRRILKTVVNDNFSERTDLEREFGAVWNTEELSRDFEVKGFMAPFVVVKHKSDEIMQS